LIVSLVGGQTVEQFSPSGVEAVAVDASLDELSFTDDGRQLLTASRVVAVLRFGMAKGLGFTAP